MKNKQWVGFTERRRPLDARRRYRSGRHGCGWGPRMLAGWRGGGGENGGPLFRVGCVFGRLGCFRLLSLWRRGRWRCESATSLEQRRPRHRQWLRGPWEPARTQAARCCRPASPPGRRRQCHVTTIVSRDHPPGAGRRQGPGGTGFYSSSLASSCRARGKSAVWVWRARGLRRPATVTRKIYLMAAEAQNMRISAGPVRLFSYRKRSQKHHVGHICWACSLITPQQTNRCQHRTGPKTPKEEKAHGSHICGFQI